MAYLQWAQLTERGGGVVELGFCAKGEGGSFIEERRSYIGGDVAPYTVAVVDLEEGGRLVGWIGDTIPVDEVEIGMEIQVVPRLFEELEEIRVYYTIERTGTTWGKAPTDG